MAKFSSYVKGECLEMCPHDEVVLREKEKLLHVLEMVPGSEKTIFPKASRQHMVKCFSRSAAGKQVNKPKNLRPPDVLLETVSYLLFDVINTKTQPFHIVCDFITDRLMAVRQDMVVQNLSVAANITILQPIVRFHAYAAYKLCEEESSNFDPVLNNKHLQECLKKLLWLYDSSDLHLGSNSSDYLLQVRPEFEALYILFNIGNDEALRRGLSISHNYKDILVKISIKISLAYKYGNFVRSCRLLRFLPSLLAAVACLHLPEIRRNAFHIMSTAYNSRNLRFPTQVLQKLLVYESKEALLSDLSYYGLNGDKLNIAFINQNFTVSALTLKPKHEHFMDSKLAQDDLENILFRVGD